LIVPRNQPFFSLPYVSELVTIIASRTNRSRARCAAHRVFNSQTYVNKSTHFAKTLNQTLNQGASSLASTRFRHDIDPFLFAINWSSFSL
jgi:hypothetical protein